MNGSVVIVCNGGKWLGNEGEERYVRDSVNNFALLIPEDVNYELLTSLVKERVFVGDDEQLLLYCKHPDDGYVFKIETDADVDMVKWVISNSIKTVHLYTTVSVLEIQQMGNPSSRKGSNMTVTCSGTKKKGYSTKKFDEHIGYEEDFTQNVGGTNPFYFMPTIPPSEIISSKVQPTHSLGPYDKITLFQKFNNKEALVLACRIKAMKERFEYITKYSDTRRYSIVCKAKEECQCEWRLYASGSCKNESFKVTKLNDEHTCTSTVLLPNHRQAKKSVMGTIIHDMMGKDITRKFKPKEIVSDMNTTYDVNVTYKKAWGAGHHARQMMKGSPEESFTQLPTYFHYLKMLNHGTKTFIDTDSEGRFEQCFFALGCAIRAFTNTCRKVMIMDGAHLKGKFKGTILHVVALDGNNQILPVGYGICKVESASTWTWFLEKLRESLVDCEIETFVTDRAPSISSGIDKVYPNAFHGVCAQHLLGNLYKDQKCKNQLTHDMFWGLVEAFKPSDYDAQWEIFCRLRPSAGEFLAPVPKEKWTRAYAPKVRYDFMTSNYAESINSLSVAAREEPIVALIEFFRATQQRWFYERGLAATACTTVLTKWAEGEVQANKAHTSGWRGYGIAPATFEVQDYVGKEIVDIVNRTCSCRVWQLTGVPCGHVVVSLLFLGKTTLASMAIDEYKTETYRRTYQECVYPVPAHKDWEHFDDLMILLPPVMERRQAGRPKSTKRIPSQGEFPTERLCSRCHKPGHTCNKCPEVAPSAAKRKEKKKGKSGASGSGTKETELDWTHGTESEAYHSTYGLD